MNDFRISQAGIDLIKEFEGLRLEAYKCSAGVPTIGWGSTRGVSMGMKITKERAVALLKNDLRLFETEVKRALRVPVTQPMFDALVSFTFNLGGTNLRTSTLLRKINDRDFKAAAREFDRWVFAGRKRERGLIRRRAAERKLFESGI